MTVATVRYFQRRGLLENSPRRLTGTHSYSQQHVFRLQFIRRAQALGFSLRESAEYLAAEGPKWYGEMNRLFPVLIGGRPLFSRPLPVFS